MKKLFMSNKFFAFNVWYCILSTVAYVVVVSLYHDNPQIRFENALRIFTSACLVSLFFSYKSHTKNVMKGMMGAVLTSIFTITLSSFFFYGEYSIFTFFAAVLTVVLFISHFLINSDHYSSPLFVWVNQIVALLFAFISLLSMITLLPDCVSIPDTVVTALVAFAQPACILSVICVETKLDAYRIKREDAGWSEENGYPADYIHEKDQ